MGKSYLKFFMFRKVKVWEHLGGSVGWAFDFALGHDLADLALMILGHEFEPRVGLCADSSEPGACFGFCVSAPLMLCLSLSLSNKKS